MRHPARLFLIAPLILVAACTIPPAQPTVTFAGDQCAYSGPDRVPMRFTVRWTVEDPGPAGAILEVVTLDAGKTRADLAGMPAEHAPPGWVHKSGYYDVAFSPGSRVFSVDLEANAAYAGDPVYLVCIYADEDTAAGAIGPIEVTK